MEGREAQPPVITILQQPKGRSSLQDTIGCLHIIYGGILLIGSILGTTGSFYFYDYDGWYPDFYYHPYYIGIWTSAVFFVSGGLAIGGARSGNKFLVVATLVMSVISAVSAGVLLTISSLLRPNSPFTMIISVLPIAIGVVMLGASITSSILSCRTLCCAAKTRETAAQKTPYNMDLGHLGQVP